MQPISVCPPCVRSAAVAETEGAGTAAPTPGGCQVLARRDMEIDTTAFAAPASFRNRPATFRDWSAETTSFPREVCEQALAHTLADKTEAACRRGDLFEKRRRLMNAWAVYCGQSPRAKVVEISA